ncbi:MAG: CotH kinase family protein [Eubacterium sp.]|nr:CotH kinase family protein [Eubacterium sp.]
MKNLYKSALSILLALTLAVGGLVAAPFVAEAVDTPKDLESSAIDFWADPENRIKADDLTAFAGGDKTSMVGAVGVFKRSNSSDNYYLFLPSNANCTSLKVWFNAGNCTVNGNAVSSGQATDVFANCNGGGVMRTYTLVLDSTSYTLNVMKSGDVGTIYIDTTSGSISKITNSSDHSTYEGGTIMVVNPDGTIEYDGALEKMSGRGNGTWSTSSVKNPYNIKLANSTKLLGMPKAKKWCLLANRGDGTLVKNQLTYDFADYIGVKYQPHCKPVDLYVNQQYYGAYNLAEKVEIKSNRINVTDNYENLEIANGTVDEQTGVVTPADMDALGLSTRTIDANNSTVLIQNENTPNYFGHAVGSRRYSAYATTSQTGTTYTNIEDPEDLTGGYLFELEISQRWAKENAGFCGYNRQGWTVKSNDYISRHQVDYCYPLLYALGSSLYNGGVVPSNQTTTNCSSLSNLSVYTQGAKSITNPAPAEKYQGKKWNELLDSQSAVKYYWTQEFFKNMDSSTSSTYFYKDVDSKDSKLYAGPLWDMDNSLGYGGNGSRWGYSYTSTDGWYTKNTRIYRWRTTDSTTSYSSDSYAPLSFYGALATNCQDFWQSAQSEWYRNVSPAVDVLTSEESVDNTVLHSVDYYVDTVAKSAAMDAYKIKGAESDDAYDTAAIKRDMKQWFADRQTWIDSQFEKVSINNCTIEVDDITYDGTPAEPKVTVKYNGAELIEGEDYTVEYSNNTSAVNNAVANVTGKGFYTGSKSTFFRILGTAVSTGTLTIPEAAYSGDTLTALYRNADGIEVDSHITYQWYSGGTAISGATSKEYTVTDSDKGKDVTVVVSGDAQGFSGTLTSNACNVKTGTKPDNYTEMIATWFYDYSINPDDLANVSTDGGYAYAATDGQMKDSALLTGSVNATSQSKIKWSSDLYANDTLVYASDYSPIIGTSKTDGVAWGTYPYFETTLSTIGYENITFSAKLGGTNKAPSTWKLQYSLDGSTYTDIDNSTYVITANKSMKDAFADVQLPDSCSNQRTVYIRAVVCSNIAINAKDKIVGVTSGDAAINNVEVKGTRVTAITSLEAPTISTSSLNGDGTSLFDTDEVSLKDNNGGADVYYNIGGEDIKYDGAFSPFGENAVTGDTVTVTAFAKFEDIVSEPVTATYTFAGNDINHFIYSTYTDKISGGALYSNGGAYGSSAKMTAYTDGNSQYVPIWNDKNGAFMLAPDDGACWSQYSGYTFALSTVGYENVTLTAKAYTTAQGPNSLTMQYSLDGGTWYTVQENKQLNANGALEQYLTGYSLPSSCANQKQIFVRLISTENATHGSATTASTTLHNNASKGNLYINNVIFAGDRTDDALMPYTNKTSDYFGDTGSLKYYSADGRNMRYSVVTDNSKIIMSGAYNEQTGIVIPSDNDFNQYYTGAYTVSVWTGDSDDRSAVNTRKYYYKGSTVCEFDYNSSTRLLDYYLNADGTVAESTGGTNLGTLEMKPNGVDNTTLVSDDTYGVKVSWASDNYFNYNKNTALDTPDGGYWLIKTSTEGYTNITLNAEQLSSNKGPRDWGIAYSTDGVNYTYVPESNAHTISNDASDSTVETYNNFALPAACSNQDELYIKLFINGGETIDGNELVDMLKGNTGIENIEISGIPEAPNVDFSINTVMLEHAGDTSGTYPVDATVTVDGREYTASSGTVELSLRSGSTHIAEVSANGTFVNRVAFTVSEDGSVTVPVVAVDINGDGIVNGRDYAAITQFTNSEKKAKYKSAFAAFVGTESDNFTYEQ